MHAPNPTDALNAQFGIDRVRVRSLEDATGILPQEVHQEGSDRGQHDLGVAGGQANTRKVYAGHEGLDATFERLTAAPVFAIERLAARRTRGFRTPAVLSGTPLHVLRELRGWSTITLGRRGLDHNSGHAPLRPPGRDGYLARSR